MARSNSSAAAGSNFRIKWDYSKADEALFTPKIKEQIEESGRLLASFIDTDQEVTIVVLSDPKVTALAIGGPSDWAVNSDAADGTPARSIAKTGGIRFGEKTLKEVRDDGSSIIALTVHEIFHAIGFVSSAKGFAQYLKNNQFSGPVTMKMNGGKPVTMDGSHFPADTKDPLGIAPRMNQGGGDSYFSVLDLSILADMGYDIPALHNAAGPIFLNFTLNQLYHEDSPFGAGVVGSGGNDILRADPATKLLIGQGGDDVLISSSGELRLVGDNKYFQPAHGKDGKDTFVIKDKKCVCTIEDLSADDQVLISPSVGITAEELATALAAADVKKTELPGGMIRSVPGQYAIKAGAWELLVTTADKQKPKAANFKLEDYMGN